MKFTAVVATTVVFASAKSSELQQETKTSWPAACINKDATSLDAVYKDCNIMQFAETFPPSDISTLVAAVVAGDLADTLTAPGPFTIFAPCNKAFEELPAGVVDNLLKPENKAALVSLLNYHVLPKQVQSKDWKPAQVVKTVEGETLHVVVDAPGKTCPQPESHLDPKLFPFICVRVGPSLKDLKKAKNPFYNKEYLLSNAAMYVIDGVLLPPSFSEELPPAANVTVQHDCKKACDCSCWQAEHRHPSRTTDGSCACLSTTSGITMKKCCGKSDILV